MDTERKGAKERCKIEEKTEKKNKEMQIRKTESLSRKSKIVNGYNKKKWKEG